MHNNVWEEITYPSPNLKGYVAVTGHCPSASKVTLKNIGKESHISTKAPFY